MLLNFFAFVADPDQTVTSKLCFLLDNQILTKGLLMEIIFIILGAFHMIKL